MNCARHKQILLCLPRRLCAHKSPPFLGDIIKRRGLLLNLKHKTPFGVLLEECASDRLCACLCRVRVPSVVSSTQALFTSAAFSKHPFYRRPRPCFWDSALAATDFTRADECPLRRSLLAFVATRRLVVFLCAIFVKLANNLTLPTFR